MAFELPALPFAPDALEPYMSKRTLEFHYGKHHKAYVDKLNEMVKGTDLESKSLEDVILATKDKQPKIFNNAGQAWNHTFFWQCLTPNAKKMSSELEDRLTESFGSMDQFETQFSDQAKNLFGSGWAWLVQEASGKLKIRALSNAGNPITESEFPLLTLDVWEHAYYLDYQNQRPKFVENFWHVVNWEFVESNIKKARM